MFETLRKSLQTASTLPCRTQVQPATSFLVCSLIFIEYETKSQTPSPFIILQEDIVFNYSFSLTSYSLFLYPNVEKTALGTVFH
ncbi:DNA or RNA helicases of superfamily II [Streptococcus pneumoniae]|nr:DNA or RNA helicases of superfamily II [Streptococcus pneumoniae]